MCEKVPEGLDDFHGALTHLVAKVEPCERKGDDRESANGGQNLGSAEVPAILRSERSATGQVAREPVGLARTKVRRPRGKVAN